MFVSFRHIQTIEPCFLCLESSFAAFGKVTDGMDVVNSIAEVQTDYSDRPMEAQTIKSMTVETFGEEYPEPEKF